MIKLFSKKDDYTTKGRFLGWGSGADADWKVLFSIFLILFLITGLLSGTLFYKVLVGSFGSELGDESELPIDRNLLKRTVNFYKTEKTTFESLKTTKETTPDPSL